MLIVESTQIPLPNQRTSLPQNRPLEVTSKSIMRPGVQTMTSVPRLSSLIWLATPEPPKTATQVTASGLANFLISCGAEAQGMEVE